MEIVEPPIAVEWRWQARPYWAHFTWQDHEVGVCRWTARAARRRAEELREYRIDRALEAEIEDRAWRRQHDARVFSMNETLRRLGLPEQEWKP